MGSTSLVAKLDVLQASGISNTSPLITGDEYSIGINLLNTFTPVPDHMQCIGIKSHVNGNSLTFLGGRFNIAGKFISENATNNIGGMFNASNGSNNYGGYFEAIVAGAQNNYGAYFEAHGGNYNYGIRTRAWSTGWGGGWKYGIWSEGSGGHSYAGYFKGRVHIDGSGTYTGTWSQGSDSVIKENVNTIKNALLLISNLKPCTFNFKTNDYPSLNLPDGNQYGMIAQDVEQMLPELVEEYTTPEEKDTSGNIISPELTLKALNYTGLIPITIQAVKELDSISTDLSVRIDSTFISADNGVSNGTSRNIQLGGSLIKSTEINLNNQDLIYTDPSTITGNNTIAIGSNLPYAKFSVNNVTHGCAGYFATSSVDAAPGYNWGIIASAINGTNLNVGGQFTATDGVYNYGTSTAATGGSYVNMGIRASGSGGVYNYAGYFDGDLVYTGNFYQASDIIFKENIIPVTNAMESISSLQPKSFTFKNSEYPYMNLPKGHRYGLIAQEVEDVLPYVVTTSIQPEQKDSAGNIISPELLYKSINYTDLIPVIIAGMKEQQGVIDSLKDQIIYLQSLIGTNAKTDGDNGNNTQYVELENVNAIILNQNDPNPFAEETDITYTLPDNVSDAKIMFYDNNGKIIKTVELIGRGDGSLHVYASNLSAGIYAYALVADGKVIDTKKMVCTKK